MTYTAFPDPLCYPDSTVLRNKLGLTDQSELDEAEAALTTIRLSQPVPAGDFGFKHYCLLHGHIFQDLYDWAGQVRTIRIGKGQNWFCYPEFIKTQAEELFATVNDLKLVKPKSKTEFAVAAAEFLATLNVIHPFREGNGRTQLSFLVMLSDRAGFVLSDEGFEKDPVLTAMIESFGGKTESLRALIENSLEEND